ncbi:serine hydrolase [Saccharibacillus sp. CPCC 101409]|uniref:D-alanyl-D-alanine carboxypeptidase family protein n=1 Tax=Saccharibacillus sp. CPCC 101409 TaxID=3058041 RepID=UPI00267377FE|nr:serine hydrolase [Saccharibacillus sp. CPCC 101409]MDO3412827.1 serine hydrolase [Saccharibacillus sp. CPCC 101409]
MNKRKRAGLSMFPRRIRSSRPKAAPRSRLFSIAIVPGILSLIIFGSETLVRPDTAAYGLIGLSPETAAASTIAADPVPELSSRNDDSPNLYDLKLRSPNAVLISLDDGSMLFKKNINQQIYPASLTKMMTVLVALENLTDLKHKVRLPNEIFPALYEEGASMAGFVPGEEVKAEDLLYGSLLPSGADASLGLALDTAGSEKAFIAKMNAKAAELGMTNTHFANVTGLQSKQHYSSVKDMAILLEYALKNPEFRKLFTAQRHSIAPTNGHPDGITVRSTLFQSAATLQFPDGEILGGKTGYTSAAGLCLASLAVKDGKEYILVTTGAKGDHTTDPYHIEDALSVYTHLN